VITPSFNLTATERVLPRLALDWTTGLAQTGVDVTRAGVATFVESNGLIQSASINTQRVDYATGTAGLLVEEARTNACRNSQNITSVTFPTIGGAVPTITVNTTDVESPAGDFTASKFDVTGAAINVQNITVTSGVAYTMSIYVHPAVSGNQVRFGWFDTQDRRVDFTLSGAGSFSALTNATSASITAYENNWYRITMTATTSSTNAQGRYLYPLAASVNYYWGAQMELGAFPTSYIPTEATAVTRNADVATMTGTNFSDWYNQTAGTFVLQYFENQNPIVSGGRMLSDTAQLRLPLYQISSSNLGSYDNTGGNVTFTSGTLVANGVNKASSAWNATNRFGCTNAGAVASGSFDGNYDLSGLRLFSAHDNANYKNGHIQKLFFYPLTFTAAQLQAATK
jgi:hypothetical protein